MSDPVSSIEAALSLLGRGYDSRFDKDASAYAVKCSEKRAVIASADRDQILEAVTMIEDRGDPGTVADAIRALAQAKV